MFMCNNHLITLYKSFKISYNYYFLIDNLSFINNLINFNFLNNLMFKMPSYEKSDKIKINFIIKKNNFFLKKKIRFFKSLFKHKFFLYFNINKLNKFFKIIMQTQLVTNKKFKMNNFFFFPNFLFNRNTIFKNWYFLTGNLINPYFWNFITKKNHIKQKIVLNFIKHKSFFKKNFKFLKFNNSTKRNFFKKLFLNNFYYMNKLNINYDDFCYLMKIKIIASDKILINSNWILTKPYLFLNNNEITKNFYLSLHILFYSLYKNSIKTFNLIKKSFLKYAWNIFFKKMNFKKSYFFSKNYLIAHKKNFFKLSFFNYIKSNNFSNTLLNFKKKKFKFNKNLKVFFFLSLNSQFKLFKIKKRYITTNFILFFVLKRKIKKNYLNSKKYKKVNLWLNLLFIANNHKNFIRLKYNKLKYNKLKHNKLLNFFCDKRKIFLNAFFWINKNLFLFNKSINLFYLNNISNKFLYVYSKSYSNVYINFKRVPFKTKEGVNFLLSKYGFVYLTDFLIKDDLKFNLIFTLKNTFYSFLYKNELQKYILKKYIRNQVTTNFLSINNNWFCKNNYWFYQNNYFNTLSNFFLNDFPQPTIHVSSLILPKYYSSKWNYFNEQALYLENQLNDNFDFNIRRIRFKPGYMNIWRDARKVLKLSLNLKMRYQYKLTRYLLRFKKFLKIKTYLYKEMQLGNILLKSRFFPDMPSLGIFIKFNLIFLNGAICLNSLIQLLLGDLIQLIVSNKYYILYKWFNNWTLKKKIKLKEIVKKKINVKINLEEKQRNYSLPKWILENKNITGDTARYLEIDYFTMSILVVYEPFSWLDINHYSLIDNKFSIFNIYNWKYIT